MSDFGDEIESVSTSYVTSVLNGEIKIEVRNKEILSALKQLGASRFLFAGRLFSLRYKDDQQLALLLSALRDLGVAFLTYAHSWPPGAIFEKLREEGLIELKGPTLRYLLRPGAARFGTIARSYVEPC